VDDLANLDAPVSRARVLRTAATPRVLLLLAGLFLALPLRATAAAPAQDAPNLALSATHRTGSYDRTTGYELKTAFDNDFQTRWDSQKGDPAWIELSWPRPVTFNRVAVYEWNNHLKRLTLQTSSDGQSGWKDVAVVGRAAGGDPVVNATEIRLPTPLTTERIRLRLDGAYISLFEVRVANVPGMATLAGHVVERGTNRPVAGATVRVVPSGETARTKTNGAYELTLEPGTYTVEAEQLITGDGTGHEARRRDAVRLAAEKPARADFALYRVRGVRRVLDGVLPNITLPKDKTGIVTAPLDVPAGVNRITLNLESLQPANGDARQGNAIDFFYRWAHVALFDPRGINEPRAFRGLGMSRNGNTAFIAPSQATPGWLPGPIPPGRWTLLWWTSPDSVDARYRLAVTFQIGGAPPDRRPVAYEPGALAPGPAWFRGDFHNHSTHSADASQSLERLVADRRASGWDFFALTDHNTISGHADAARLAGNQKPLILLGEEVTTEFGHFNTFGLPVGWWSDFRIQPGDDSLFRLMEKVHAAGGQISLNHPGYPNRQGTPFDWQDGLDAVEIWNGADDAALQKRLVWCDALLTAGKRPVLIGGSDIHHPDQAHTPITWVYAAELSRPALLQAVRAGHAVLTRDFGGPFTNLEADADGDNRFETQAGDTARPATAGAAVAFRATVKDGAGKTLRVLTDGGAAPERVAITSAAFVHEFSRSGSTRWVRLEVVEEPAGADAPPRYLALTNPVYVQPAR